MGTTPGPLDQLNADVDQLTSDLTAKFQAISDEIANLKAQIASGTAVTQAQLDALDAKVKAADSAVTTFATT